MTCIRVYVCVCVCLRVLYYARSAAIALISPTTTTAIITTIAAISLITITTLTILLYFWLRQFFAFKNVWFFTQYTVL